MVILILLVALILIFLVGKSLTVAALEVAGAVIGVLILLVAWIVKRRRSR